MLRARRRKPPRVMTTPYQAAEGPGPAAPRRRPRRHLGLAPDLFPNDRPGASRPIGELGKVVGRELAFGRGPGRLHAGPIVPIELDDRIPAGVLPVRIGLEVVLHVSAQAGQPTRQRAVLAPEELLKL